MTATKTNEPNRFQIIASYDCRANTKLARAVYPIMSWGIYDRHQAHTWALRLIMAAPQNGEDCAAALINFDYMVPAARAKYQASAHERAKMDKVFAIYAAWAAMTNERTAA
jgi:hypothetical protein